MELGVAKGIRVTLNADNEPRCRGASIEEALLHAEAKAAVSTGEKRDFLLTWIEAAWKQIRNDQLEARVDKHYEKEYEPREKYGANLPRVVRDAWKEQIRDEIRSKLKLQ